MGLDELKNKLITAIECVYSRDADLLGKDVHEDAINHRLALYLEIKSKFPSWDIDCQYNRDKEGLKRKDDGGAVRPDIIIHKRGTDNNLALIEVKKENNRNSDDEKIKMLGNLDYEYLIALRFGKSGLAEGSYIQPKDKKRLPLLYINTN